MQEFPLRGPGAALADIYLAMTLARTGRSEEAVPLLQKLIGGRDQFVGLAGQSQASVELVQDMMKDLRGRLGGNMPNIEIPAGMPASARAGMESGMLMSGELFHIGPACALLQEIHFQANAPERALEAAEQCRARVLARSLADRSFQRQRTTMPTQQEARAYARKNRVDESEAYQALLKERMSNPAAEAASRPATVADMRRAAADRNATILVYAIHTEPGRLPDRMPDREVGVTVVDPRWVSPVDPALSPLAARHKLVITVEDSSRAGGAGSGVARALEDADVDVPLRTIGLPKQFLDHGKPADVRAAAGLNPAAIAERALIGLKRKTSAPDPAAEPAMVERSA